MPQIGCAVCLKLKAAYFEALRQDADSMQRQINFIADGDFSHARESEAAIRQAHDLCVQRRHTLDQHDATAHKKAMA